jgi:phosphatidylserine decarboxylase
MVRDGIPFVAVPVVLAMIPILIGYWPIALVFLFVAAFMAFFFRDPSRTIPTEPGIIVAPADGRVTLVRRSTGEKDSESLVSIFLSPLDVHLNRAPMAGRITKIEYKPGKFLMATDERARLLNEQNALTIEGNGLRLTCTQIAGILARRIVCWKKAGERVECGERFGMIKFGSRTDLLMPPTVEVTIEEGMRVRGGVTIIGRIKA